MVAMGIKGLISRLFPPPPIPDEIGEPPWQLFFICACGSPMFSAYQHNGEVEWNRWDCPACRRVRFSRLPGVPINRGEEV